VTAHARRPPVVLVPGMLCDGALWDGVREVFGDRRTVDVSLVGRSIDSMAEDVLAAVQGEFVLVGLSLGAIVGFEVCRRAPERVAAFAALSTNAGPPRADQLASWADAERAVARGDFAQVVESVLPAMFRDPAPEPALAAAFRAMAARVGPDRLRAQLAAQATRVDALPGLARYGGPVLVLCGERDALCPPAFHTAIARTAPNARLHTLPGAGHLLPLEQPAAVATQLHDWPPLTH
jgi:pimeloyl-ACP methyl ester carboxylesterase